MHEAARKRGVRTQRPRVLSKSNKKPTSLQVCTSFVQHLREKRERKRGGSLTQRTAPPLSRPRPADRCTALMPE